MRALVTGGAGFLGSALVERLLASGDEVDVVDDLSSGSIGRLAVARGHGRAFRFHQIDICQPEAVALLERRRPEVVFHLAALTGAGREGADLVRDAEVSVVGTLRVLEGARAAGGRKVVYGASAELAAGAGGEAVRRGGPLGAHLRGERAALEYLGLYRERHGLEFTALALGCVYGPGHADHGPVAALAAAIADGRPCEVGEQECYDLVYLDDAVDALVRAGARGSGLLVPVGTGQTTTAARLVEQMAAIAGRTVVVERRRVPVAARSALDPMRARLHLGWAPFTALEDGLAAVLAEPLGLVAGAGAGREMIAVLAGGVGAARFLRGLLEVVSPAEVTVIVNTGDDAVVHGLHVSPDLDTVTYTLCGVVNPETGWGRRDETFAVMEGLERYGSETWFRLGDRDLATHLYRTERRAAGATLSEVTTEIAKAWGIEAHLLPMSDDSVATRVELADGAEVEFQEYFVRLRHDVPIRSVRFSGIEDAAPAPGVLSALGEAETVVIAPSNPIVSIGPILALGGVAEVLADRRERVVAISPIVAGEALKGPAARMLDELGHDKSALGVARLLAPVAGAIVLDVRDAALVPLLETLGLRAVVTETVMASLPVAAGLARAALGAAGTTGAGARR